MKNSAEVLMKIEQNRAQIKKFGVRRLGLFGSAARHEASSSGDLDFLVEFENKSFDAYIDLKFYLEDLFRCKIDLVTPEALKPALKQRILQEVVYPQRL